MHAVRRSLARNVAVLVREDVRDVYVDAVVPELRPVEAEPERVRLISSEKADRFFFDNYLYLCPECEPQLTLQPEEVVDACFIELREIDGWKDRLCPPTLERWERNRAAIEEAAAQCRLSLDKDREKNT